MQVTNELLPWTTDDATTWREFLLTEHGKRLIPKVLEEAPMLLDGADVNQSLVRMGEVRGWEACVRYLYALTRPLEAAPESPALSNYPDLNDDKAWNDGLKIALY